jgi:CBS domain containing-hemolysin-like protein
MTLLFVYLLFALLISFLCSIAESVLLSVSASYVKAIKDKEKKSTKLLKKFKVDVNKPLSSILVFNTIANVVGAAGVGTQATLLWGETIFGYVSATLTILLLFFSEIIPKSIGARYWRKLAVPVALIINLMIFAVFPIVLVSNKIMQAILGKNPQKTVNRDEVAALTEIGSEEGIFAESESKTIKNMIQSSYIKACKVMTPRTVVVAVEGSTPLNKFFDKQRNRNYTRFPVYKNNSDNIIGYALRYDITDKLVKNEGDMQVRNICRPVVICYENINILKLLNIMVEKKEQIAVLIDEYGGMSGLITIEDIIETIFGLEIIDERDQYTDLQELAKKRWCARAKKINVIHNQT